MSNVSCIITTYKRDASVLKRAIESVINQTYKVAEIIVVDDNQDINPFSEEIEKVCNEYEVVHYIKQNGNKGACAARNIGIKNSHGRYIGFLDEDDTWLPKKIELQMAAFETADEEVAMIYCGAEIYNETNGTVSQYYNAGKFNESLTFDNLIDEDGIGCTSIPLIKKEVFYKVGFFWEGLPARQDYEMWLRISQEYKIKGIKDILFRYHIHDGEQISKNKRNAYWGFRKVYSRYRTSFRKSRKGTYNMISGMYHNIYGFSFYNFYVFIMKVLCRL